MPATTQELLLADLDTYIRTQGQGGKITAADLRTFLTRLIMALTDSLSVGQSRVFRIVMDQDQRDALPAGSLEADGFSAGERTADMFVYVIATTTLYHLHIPGFPALSDAAKVTALADNSHWIEYSSNAFTAITANQYGTHPAFTTQHALNIYLLAHTQGAVGPIPAAPAITSEVDTNDGATIDFAPNTTHLAATDYEYRVTAIGYPTSAWQPCTSFHLVLDNEGYGPGAIEIRVAAADGYPAGEKALNTVAFTQHFYPIMLKLPTYDAATQTLTITARNDGDANTAVILDGTFLGYIGGDTNQYNTKSFPMVLSLGNHTIQGTDGRNIYTTPLRTFTVESSSSISLPSYGMTAFGFHGESPKATVLVGTDVLVNSITNVAGQSQLLPFEPAHKLKILSAQLNGKAVFDFGEAVGIGLHTTFAGNTQASWTIFTVYNMSSYGTYGTGYLEVQQDNPEQTSFAWYRQSPVGAAGSIQTQGADTQALSTLNAWKLVVNYVDNGVAWARVNKVGQTTNTAPVAIPTGTVIINPGKMGHFGRSNYVMDFRGQMALQWGYAGILTLAQIQEVEEVINAYYGLGL